MKAIDLIRWAMRMTDEATAAIVKDMRDAPMTQPTSRGGNHPRWVLAHLGGSGGATPGVLSGEPTPLEHWTPLSASGARPTPDAEAYPPFDEVRATYRDLRAKNLRRLEEVGEA